MYIYLGLGL